MIRSVLAAFCLLFTFTMPAWGNSLWQVHEQGTEIVKKANALKQSAQNTAEHSIGLSERMKELDVLLNKAYKEVLTNLKNTDAELAEQFVADQRSWLKFVEKYTWKAADNFGGGGTIYALTAGYTKLNLWLERIAYFCFINDNLDINWENGDDENTAEVSQGERINLFTMPKAEELACNGAVDEEAFKNALETWIQSCNAYLNSYANMDSEQAARLIMSDYVDYFELKSGKVESCAESLLNRWIDTMYEDKVLNSDDQKILKLLASYGLEPEIVDGFAYLYKKDSTIHKRIKLDPMPAEYKAYMALKESQPDILFSGGGCRYSVKEMGTWAVQWERFLKSVPANSFYSSLGKKHYTVYMDFLFFCEEPMTAAFDEGTMSKEWRADLESLVKENPNTETAALIAEFLGKIKADKYTLTSKTKKTVTAKLHQLFVPKELLTAEEKLRGKHMYSLQWIEGAMGEATVSKESDGSLKIDAYQSNNKDFTSLRGSIHIIDDKTFTVIGELMTQVSHNANGEICKRLGEFEFKVTQNRKYWRLQQMQNPCDNVLDYVDIYFKGL